MKKPLTCEYCFKKAYCREICDRVNKVLERAPDYKDVLNEGEPNKAATNRLDFHVIAEIEDLRLRLIAAAARVGMSPGRLAKAVSEMPRTKSGINKLLRRTRFLFR